MASTDSDERKLFARFEKHDQFIELQNNFLDNDLAEQAISDQEDYNENLLRKLSMILNEYHEQSYLLDPYIESLVVPVVDRLKYYAKLCPENDQSSNHLTRKMALIANLLYNYIKFRGYKSIVKFFPHEVADLNIALDCMLRLSDEHSEWHLRYVILIWLYLICMIPFDLSQFDERDEVGRTADRLEGLAKSHIGKAGLERDGAALLLSRLYMRKDTSSRFPSHLQWTLNSIKSGENVILSIGALQVVCQVAKDGPIGTIRHSLSDFLSIIAAIDNNADFQNNTHIRKLKYKLSARLAIRLLPPRRIKMNRNLGKSLTQASESELLASEEEQDISTDVEDILQQMFEGLQDRDTIVRWSAAKGVARIAERLPEVFVEQVLEMVMNLFSVHSVAVASIYDLPAIAESTWHGASLACAEIARRGLISKGKLPELIDWLLKGLYFDLRKGAHSIGSNVRDATAYVLWSLARTQTSDVLAPHAEGLARHLTAVALFDREVHVRRAASAAFQEFVGRTALFPSGIDVLRKTDFYAVSVRRNAFLEAAPQVSEHEEYRVFLIEHLINVSLRHWDITIRELAAQSLHRILLTGFSGTFHNAFAKSANLLDSVDIYDLHGGLLALGEIAKASESHFSATEQGGEEKDLIFESISRLSDDVLFGHRYDIVTAATCRLIASTFTSKRLAAKGELQAPRWKRVVEFGIKHRNPSVQEAAAEAMGRMSGFQDCTQDVERYVSSTFPNGCRRLTDQGTLIQELSSSSPSVQQGLGQFLGVLRYDINPLGLEHVIATLLDCVSPAKRFNIEARRTCYQAMPQIVITVARHLKDRISAHQFQSLFRALLNGLGDYTNDERGDVGSWIRITCIKGLSSILERLFKTADMGQDLVDYLPSDLYHSAVAGILKQGLERLDNVRQVAGDCFITLLKLSPSAYPKGEQWILSGNLLFKDLLLSETEPRNWSDGSWFFPKAVRFLEIANYRSEVLAGIVTSIGSKTDSIQRPMAKGLVAYTQTLPVVAADRTGAFDAITLVDSLTDLGKRNFSNNNIVIPIFLTINALLEGDAIQRLSQHPLGLRSLEGLLNLVMKNVSHIKSVARVHESMKIVVNLLTVEPLIKKTVHSLKPFFQHRIPRVRMDTAEYSYLGIQSAEFVSEVDEIEAVILETEWMSNDQQVIENAFDQIQSLLLRS